MTEKEDWERQTKELEILFQDSNIKEELKKLKEEVALLRTTLNILRSAREDGYEY